MALMSCTVSFTALDGSRHIAEVTAESLYEAAALGLKALQSARFADSAPGLATRLEIEITQPVVRHVVTVGQLRTWLEQGSTNPAEMVKRNRLRQLLGAK